MNDQRNTVESDTQTLRRWERLVIRRARVANLQRSFEEQTYHLYTEMRRSVHVIYAHVQAILAGFLYERLHLRFPEEWKDLEDQLDHWTDLDSFDGPSIPTLYEIWQECWKYCVEFRRIAEKTGIGVQSFIFGEDIQAISMLDYNLRQIIAERPHWK